MENSLDLVTSMTAGEKYFFYGLDKEVRNIKCPHPGVDYAIKDFKHSLGVVLKEEQIMTRPQGQIDDIIEWAQNIAILIMSKGIECYVIGRKSLGE